MRVGFLIYGVVLLGCGLVVVMWQELSWGLPLAEILQCTHSVDVGSFY